MKLSFTKVQRKFSFLGLFFCFGSFAFGQLTTQYDTPANLINNVLVGNGLNVSNISSQGAPLQFGRFNGVNSNLGIGSGVVIATCDINPPNGLSAGNFLNSANTPGDPLLTQLANGSVTNNAGIIQFDFIPGGDTLEFDYVFASAEYNFYVNSTFNDVFGFFLTGPKPGCGQVRWTNQSACRGWARGAIRVASIPNAIALIVQAFTPSPLDPIALVAKRGLR